MQNVTKSFRQISQTTQLYFIVSISDKKHIANPVLVPTLIYDSDSWVWLKKHESRLNAVLMRSLEKICNMQLYDRVMNVIRKRGCSDKYKKGYVEVLGMWSR